MLKERRQYEGPKKIGDDARRMLIFATLYREREGRGPALAFMWQRLGMPPRGGRGWRKLERLQERGYVVWEDNIPHSLRVTPLGLRAATTGLHQRDPRAVPEPQSAVTETPDAASQVDFAGVKLRAQGSRVANREEAAMATSSPKNGSNGSKPLDKEFLQALRREVKGVKLVESPSALHERIVAKGKTLAYLRRQQHGLRLHVRLGGGQEDRFTVADQAGIAEAVEKLKQVVPS
jgi:hypothetical protein